MYWLNYLDRNAIALAKLDNIDKDLKLTPTQYSTCVSILFVGMNHTQAHFIMTQTHNSQDIFLVVFHRTC